MKFIYLRTAASLEPHTTTLVDFQYSPIWSINNTNFSLKGYLFHESFFEFFIKRHRKKDISVRDK